MKTLTLNSFAKVNLYLRVLGKRKDNYHNLITLFERIGLHDTIILTLRTDTAIRIISRSRDIPRNSANLAWRSARLLQESCRVKKGVDITIVKRIPVGGGMGGGSSNAAAVLLGLNKLWRLHLKRERLLAMARKIGADVPFFIYEVPFACAGGRGDRIKPSLGLQKSRFWHVVVVPRLHVATPLIYRAWDKLTSRKKVRLTKPINSVKLLTLALKKIDLLSIGEALYNDLEQVTFTKYPEVKAAKIRLAQSGLKAILMSGSGPAVFAVVPSRKEALSVYRQLVAKRHQWQVFVTRTC